MKELLPDADERLFTSPNNILGIEYTKAILRFNADIEILPIPRTGAGYSDGKLQKNYSSASAIRSALLNNAPKEDIFGNLPPYVVDDLPLFLSENGFRKLDAMEYYALLSASAQALKDTPDCTEGLENRLLKLTETYFSAEEIVSAATSKRYTSARIRRILLANALRVTTHLQDRLLNGLPYLQPLAIFAPNADMVLSGLQNNTKKYPLLTRKGEEETLQGESKELFSLTARADEIYAALCERKNSPFALRFIEKRE